MDMQAGLNSEQAKILLDIHSALMTWNVDEQAVLRSVCEILSSLRSGLSIFCALLDDAGELRIAAAAGVWGAAITGLSLGKAEGQDHLGQCVQTGRVVNLENGLSALGCASLEIVPAAILQQEAILHPLTLQGTGIGLIGIVDRKRSHRSLLDPILFQMVAQHTGFALGMLRTFAQRDAIIGELQLAAAVFDSSLDSIFITDSQGTILKVNAAAMRVTGYTADEMLGRNPRIFQSGRHDRTFYAELWRSVMQTGRWQGEIWNRRKNGEVFPELLSISAIRDRHGAISNYISIFIDISAQKEAERRLDYLANHDRLTGLPNRDLFHDRLLVALAQAKRNRQPIAVLFIDLDHFKYINDTFGHAIGDELLRAAAQRIQGSLREEDTLSRISGDEFTILLQHFDSREEVGLVAGKILSAMKSPFGIGEHELYISASIGISTYPEDGDHPELLLKNSDTAMYHAKSDGRGGMQFFRSSMEGYSIQRLELERHLYHALEQEEFLLFYQPQFDLNTGRLTGMEALLRWQRPDVGLVSPQDFIPLAEETGLIVPIGEWVLRTACKQGSIWGRTGAGPVRLAVNISAQQFSRADFCDMVGTILADTGFPPDCLELELTESLAMHHAEETVLTLKKLKALGVQISIDDFGTGYSSLSYLKRFPVDSLKIDKSFVDGIADDPNDAAIVIAIIVMAHSLGLGVIAEGVETQEQLDFLKMHHCNEVQGFLLGRPMPAGHVEKLLADPARPHKEKS
jgi:diguanylate cyclase (GGDEF)-like protein/PAS domain S-box-containing protein